MNKLRRKISKLNLLLKLLYLNLKFRTDRLSYLNPALNNPAWELFPGAKLTVSLALPSQDNPTSGMLEK